MEKQPSFTYKYLNYLSLFIPALMAVLALNHFGFFFKSGSAGFGALIILLLFAKQLKTSTDVLLIVGAFAFSIAGDWFLSNKHGDAMMFVYGITMFFVAHVGYLAYALRNGRIKWIFTAVLLTCFLLFFFLVLHPGISDKTLMMAALIYLLISCFSLGAAAGIDAEAWGKRAFILGIFLILFSDTIIAFKEFVGYKELNFLILPTYYLAHLSITFSLIRRKLMG